MFIESESFLVEPFCLIKRRAFLHKKWEMMDFSPPIQAILKEICSLATFIKNKLFYLNMIYEKEFFLLDTNI